MPTTNVCLCLCLRIYVLPLVGVAAAGFQQPYESPTGHLPWVLWGVPRSKSSRVAGLLTVGPWAGLNASLDMRNQSGAGEGWVGFNTPTPPQQQCVLVGSSHCLHSQD